MGRRNPQSPKDSLSPPEVSLPPVEWEAGSQCLGPLLRQRSLPLVVTCDRNCLSGAESVNFDFAQPILLHTRRTVRKVVASSAAVLPSPPQAPKAVLQQQQRSSRQPQPGQRSPSQPDLQHLGLSGGNGVEGGGGGLAEMSLSSSSSSLSLSDSGSATTPGPDPVQGLHLRVVGDHLLIPEDYKGWFAVLGSPEDAKMDRVVPYFRQVAQLALSKCQSFLIGGKDPVPALHIPVPGGPDDRGTQPRVLYPGDVLRMGKLYVGESTIRVKKKLFGPKTTLKKEEKFLLCMDDTDREVYLPVESRGTFYVLTTEGGGLPRIPIVRMPDVCTHFRFPCLVKLLFGRVPATPCSFTGTLLLQDSQMESSVIGCTMINLRNILLDIPTDSDLRFFPARPSGELLTSRAYRNALALCQEKAQTYMRNMKVAYYFANEDLASPESEREASPGEGKNPSDSVTEGRGSAGGKVRAALPQRQQSLSEAFRGSGGSFRSRPSIVEDQELFGPPETGHTGAGSGSAANSSGHGPGVDGVSAVHSVLKKDFTYYLPEIEAETLPVRSVFVSSVPASQDKRPSRPLPPACPSEPHQEGGYISMNQADKRVATGKGPAGELGRSSAGPKPPARLPKPAAARSPECVSNSEASTYLKLWDGQSTTATTTANATTSLPGHASPTSRDRGDCSTHKGTVCQCPEKLVDLSYDCYEPPGRCGRASSSTDSYIGPDFGPACTNSTPTDVTFYGRTANLYESQNGEQSPPPLPDKTTPSRHGLGLGLPGLGLPGLGACEGPDNNTLQQIRAGYLTPVSCAPPPFPPPLPEMTQSASALGLRTADETRYESIDNLDSPNQHDGGYQTMSSQLQEGYISMNSNRASSGSSSSSTDHFGLANDQQNLYANDLAALRFSMALPRRPAPRLTPKAPMSAPGEESDGGRGSQPPPCLPRQNAQDLGDDAEVMIEFANAGCGSDFSSVSQSCEYASRQLCAQDGVPLLPPLPDLPQEDCGYIGMQRESSFTYYEGCKADQDHSVIPDSALIPEEDEDALYENVHNLRVCHSSSFSQGSNVSSDASDGSSGGGAGRFMEKLANPPSIFGYASPPSPRPAVPRAVPPVLPAKPTSSLSALRGRTPEHQGTREAKPTSFDSQSSSEVFLPRHSHPPLPPLPTKPYRGARSSDPQQPPSKSLDEERPPRESAGTRLSASPKDSSSSQDPSEGSSLAGVLRRRLRQTASSEDDPEQLADSLSPFSGDSDASSRPSSEDDLPLGATYACCSPSPSKLADSGCALNSVGEWAAGDRRGGQTSRGVSGTAAGGGGGDLATLSMADLGEAFKSVGLHPDTVQALRAHQGNGRFLLAMDEEQLREALPGARKLDLKKLCMFIGGWRPSE